MMIDAFYEDLKKFYDMKQDSTIEDYDGADEVTADEVEDYDAELSKEITQMIQTLILSSNK